ncbi:TrkA family potassium uptake protein [Streptomyces thermospinosisporus]|uniref:Trk system potassium uptake protein TrkA n=1 Tax=Streptomyces thermospinosisporus TaxID=161482 RepID=A0ABP4JLZ7_9ACTN
MNVLIAGAGRLGAQTAQVFAQLRNKVVLIESDDDRVAELAGRLPGVRLLSGDACDPAVLEHAGARAAELVVAVTGDDADNLVISLLAARRFSVPRVAARVNDAENAWLFDARWGVDVAVPAAVPLISLIEEATATTDTVALLRLSRAGVDVIETTITPRSKAAGRALGEVVLPEGTVVATIVRDGRPTVPDPAVRLRAGDEILLVAHSATERDIRAAFQ